MRPYEIAALPTYRVAVSEGLLGAAAVSLRSLGFGDDSSFQNSAEFITKVVSLVSLARLGFRDETMHFIGDSKSALSWALKGRATGKTARNAVIVFALLAQELGITVSGTDHLRGDAR